MVYDMDSNNILTTTTRKKMRYIKDSKNDFYYGIKCFDFISSRRKRRCKNYQIKFFGREERTCYDITVYMARIPCILYKYSF